ncbi:HAD family phosphatase [Patescibacteria group bacterium]|nr:HAD family phosphatase [Patescibacteria group bacterium]
MIFDLDGTVLDNEDEYGIAFKEVLSKLGVETNSEFPHTQGIGVEENWQRLIPKHKIKTKKSTEELSKETQEAYLKMLSKVTFKNGVKDFVKDLKDSGVFVALATSNTWPTVEKVFDAFNLEGIFETITTGEEVKLKKPDSEIFLLTAQKLGIDPENCLVIEDTVAGIKAAQNAGMKVVAIARDSKHAKLLQKAKKVIYDYGELSPDMLTNI